DLVKVGVVLRVRRKSRGAAQQQSHRQQARRAVRAGVLGRGHGASATGPAKTGKSAALRTLPSPHKGTLQSSKLQGLVVKGDFPLREAPQGRNDLGKRTRQLKILWDYIYSKLLHRDYTDYIGSNLELDQRKRAGEVLNRNRWLGCGTDLSERSRAMRS